MSFPVRKPLDALLLVVLVDGKHDQQLAETTIQESMEWEDFLQTLYNITIPIMSSIVRISTPEHECKGLSIDDGDWWYRIIGPVSRSADSTRSLVNIGEWKFLNCRIGFRRMMDQIYYGHGMADCYVEVQHQMQRDTAKLEQELEDTAEQEMLQDVATQAHIEQKQQFDTLIQSGLRGYYDQLIREPVRNQHNTRHNQFQLKYTSVSTYQYQPMTKAELEADQAAAMNAAAGFSFARDLTSGLAPKSHRSGNSSPPVDVQAKRRFLGGHTKRKRKEMALVADMEDKEEKMVVVKEMHVRREVKNVAAEGKGIKMEVDEETKKAELKEKQSASRAARAARRSGDF